MQVGLTSVNEQQNTFDSFHSPTKGPLHKEAVFSMIEQTVSRVADQYEIIVGADSQLRSHGTSFAVVIALIHIGHGGTFFYHKFWERRLSSLQQRIYSEAIYAVGLASELREYLKMQNLEVPIRLHFDIGRNGPTNKFINYLLHMAHANNFAANIKPDSFCASTIADKFTK
jgi:predicted RNase H-related nuclease YkuK (DUF458 family)